MISNMLFKYKYFGVGLFILLIQSCDPPAPLPTYKIDGTIYVDCSMIPYANKSIILFQNYKATGFGGSETGGDVAYATTDSMGHFSLDYQPVNDYNIELRDDSNGHILFLPLDTNITSLVGYYNPTTTIQLSINVINAHTETDTLHITYYDGTSSYFVLGPFISQVLWTASDLPILAASYYGTISRILWQLNTYSGSYNEYYYQINTYCGDTTFVAVDIY